MLLVEEYLSFPTNTLYTKDEAERLEPPAFTFCPVPSIKAFAAWDEKAGLKGFQDYLNASVAFEAFVLQSPYIGSVMKANISTVNGEITRHLADGENPEDTAPNIVV